MPPRGPPFGGWQPVRAEVASLAGKVRGARLMCGGARGGAPHLLLQACSASPFPFWGCGSRAGAGRLSESKRRRGPWAFPPLSSAPRTSRRLHLWFLVQHPGGETARESRRAGALAGKAGEPEDRVKLDSVRCDSGLAVEEVEERDASDTCVSADARDTPGIPHLLPSVGGCASRAERRRSLGDHRLLADTQDVVVIEIGFARPVVR
jgi:hypothetical protein